MVKTIKIFPSIMAKNQQQINYILKKMEGIVKELHLDVVDGKFLLSNFNWFNFKLSKKYKYNAHLMVKDPAVWIEKKGSRFQTIIFHPEPVRDVKKVIELIKSKKKKVGLALKPGTTVNSIKKYLSRLDVILVLTVHPGKYGAKFLQAPLKKIKQIKKINPKIKVIVDGGIKPGTIKDAVRAGGDYFISGSFITCAENPNKAMKELKSAL